MTKPGLEEHMHSMKQTHRPMEQIQRPRNKSIHAQSTNS